MLTSQDPIEAALPVFSNASTRPRIISEELNILIDQSEKHYRQDNTTITTTAIFRLIHQSSS